MTPGFSERYLLQPEQFALELGQYRKYIRDMIAIADPTADADEFAADIVDFSKSLAKVGETEENCEKVDFTEPMTVSKVITWRHR